MKLLTERSSLLEKKTVASSFEAKTGDELNRFFVSSSRKKVLKILASLVIGESWAFTSTAITTFLHSLPKEESRLLWGASSLGSFFVFAVLGAYISEEEISSRGYVLFNINLFSVFSNCLGACLLQQKGVETIKNLVWDPGLSSLGLSFLLGLSLAAFKELEHKVIELKSFEMQNLEVRQL